MKKTVAAILATITSLSAAHVAKADVIADWTFETSQPTTAGPFNPEIGAGSASLSGLISGATISNPAGNGSSHSFSANDWQADAYFQFAVNTVGYSGITLSFDQTSSNTGPGSYQLEYSTDGINFVDFGTAYSILANASPNPTWNGTTSSSLYTHTYDLSSIVGLGNDATVDFRLVDLGGASANGGTEGTAGTDRVDNFVVNGTTAPVPEPSTLALCGLGAAGVLFRLRRKI